MSADYFVVVPRGRWEAATLEDAYRLAWRLLQGGASEVEIRQRKTAPDVWGPPTGEEGLLHRLVPAEHPVAPAGGHGSTATFPPYVWRMLLAVDPEPAPAVEEGQPQQLGFSLG